MRGDAPQISSTLATPRAVSRIAWTRSGFGQAGLRLELGEQAVDVVDVLGSLDLGDHDHVELVADLGDGGGEVVETPRRVEAVDPRPELRVAEVDVLARPRRDRRAPLPSVGTARRPRGWRAGCRPSARCRAPWRRIFVVGGREEVDHPARPERDLADGLGGADGERPEEVLGRAHRPQPYEKHPNHPKVT